VYVFIYSGRLIAWVRVSGVEMNEDSSSSCNQIDGHSGVVGMIRLGALVGVNL
jgi:hypothetical protein